MPEGRPGGEPPSHVVVTAGHVDHGKSSLIVRLTGIDPDRLAEEKRRGLTIDLGFAWCALPSGLEIGFVDVPGHERFVRNMLAGVGPVRLVLFVVAADEGWKPQSEEHLAIVDVLGVHGAVVALTKADLVDEETLSAAEDELRHRLRGTALEGSPLIACSASTGRGLDELVSALDAMVRSAPMPEDRGRPRQSIDRVFTIAGAGTVVTGTLTGGRLSIGDEVEVYPSGVRARVRGLQMHGRTIEVARPVSRVAANLVGLERASLERGDLLGGPGQWRPTATFEARIEPVRGLSRPLTERGAFKLYAGAAERDARIRLYGGVPAGAGAFARIRLSEPIVLDVHDRFVLRDSGRRETVAGGLVLDPHPPARPGPDATGRLQARADADRTDLPRLLVRERRAVRGSDLGIMTGVAPTTIEGARRVGEWWVADDVREAVAGEVRTHLEAFHEAHPLVAGPDVGEIRVRVADAVRGAGGPGDRGLADALLEGLVAEGSLAREGSAIRLATHRVALPHAEVERLVAAVAAGGPTPPTVGELRAAGFAAEMIDAAAASGALVRIAPDLVLTPAFVERAIELVREAGPAGVSVSAVRQALGTSRRYAVPLMEHLDRVGLTRRVGDLRYPRAT